MASSDFPRPCIIGVGILAFPMRTWGHKAIGQTRDLPGSDAILSCVMRSSTTAERQPSHIGAAHVAFDVAYRLGLCELLAFAAQ
jgi:hypothetical protein